MNMVHGCQSFKSQNHITHKYKNKYIYASTKHIADQVQVQMSSDPALAHPFPQLLKSYPFLVKESVDIKACTLGQQENF